MISKLHLVDVKTYKDTILDFSSGVNVITGDSGQGKTNILLALTWVKDNRPLGSGCIRRGQSAAAMTMEVVDGKDTYSVIRKRSTTENSYALEKNGEKIGEPLTSFGQSPPKVISDILDMSDINIQKQRDSHFLVYSPPGQIATFIRSITKLDEIDRVNKLTTSQIRAEKIKIAQYDEELKSVKKKLDTLNALDLEALENMIDKAKDKILRIEEVSDKIERIGVIVDALKILEKNRIVLPDNLDQIFEDVEKYSIVTDKVLEDMNNLRDVVDKIKRIEVEEIVLPNNLDEIFEDVEKCIEVVTSGAKRISIISDLVDRIKDLTVKRIVLPEDFSILVDVELAIEKYTSTDERMEILLKLLEEIYSVILKIKDSDVLLKQLEHEEKKLKEQLDICPSCGMKLTEKSKLCLLGRGALC